MEELRTWLWRATVALGVVLLVTGVWLAFFSEPTRPGSDDEQLLRVVHRISSSALLPVPLAVCLAALRRRSSTVAASGV